MTIGTWGRLALAGLPLFLVMLAGGCNRSADNAGDRTSFAVATEHGKSPFGPGFDKASHASANAEPMNVVEGDLAPVNAHKEPVLIE